MNAIYTRLLCAWDGTVKNGLCLNPTQFLILCDVLENPAEPISASKRAQRLRLTQPTVSLALRFLETLGLATVIENTAPGGFTLTAQPTRAAYHLFGLKGPRQLPPPAAQPQPLTPT
jgi:hypothetical protein